MQIKNYTGADFEDLIRLGNELEIHGQVSTPEDLKAALSKPNVEPEKDNFLIVDEGEAVGRARIYRNTNLDVNRHNFWIMLPEYLHNDDALLDKLISVCERRINEISLEYPGKPLQIRSGGYDEEKWLHKALERNGYEFNRYFARMDMNDISGLSEPGVISGVTIRQFDPDKEKSEFLAAFNLGFKGHFEQSEFGAEEFDHYLGTHWYQPENVFLAENEGKIVGVCICSVNREPEADGLIWGVVGDLAVIPEWRGKGLGRALIRRGQLALRSNGAQKICLWLDYANPFGAKKLYYSEGYEDRYIDKSYAKDE